MEGHSTVLVIAVVALAAAVGMLAGLWFAWELSLNNKPWWLPSYAHRMYVYLLAIKTLAWDEKDFSGIIENVAGIPILTVSGAAGTFLCRNMLQPRKVKKVLKQLLLTPPSKSSRDSSVENCLVARENADLPVRRLVF